MDFYSIAWLLIEGFHEGGFERQQMSAITERQKRRLEIVTIYGTADLYGFTCSKNGGGLRPNDARPAAIYGVFYRKARERLPLLAGE